MHGRGKLFQGRPVHPAYDPINPHGEPTPAPVKLAIYGFTYTVREIPANDCGSVAYQMHRIDTNHTYAVIKDVFGEVSCSCPDFELRRAGTGFPASMAGP